MALPRPLCTRIPPELEAELEARFFELDWNASEGLRNVIREWLASARYDRLEFRDTVAGRRAAIRDGPEVWEVAAAAGPNRAMSAALGQRFAWVRGEALEQALAYARRHPGRIERIIRRHERLEGG